MVTRLTRPNRVFASFVFGALLAGLGAADSGASLPVKEAGKVVVSGTIAPTAPELKSLGVRTFAPAPKSSPTEILFQNGIRFETTQGEPDLPRGLRMNEATDADERIGLLVQVQAPCRQEWIGLLERAGARIQFYVPNYAFLVRIQAKDRSAIEALPFVTWTGLYHPAYRISGQTAMSSRTGRGEYQALLFDDGDLADVVRQVQFLGGQIEDSSDNGINKIVRFSVDRMRMEQVAAHRDVQWIEPREHFTTDNSQVQWVDMTFVSNDRKIWDKGITGTGQVVMVGDSGIRTTHNQFRDAGVPITDFGNFPTHRKVIAYIRSTNNNDIVFGDTFSGHGTHTSCTFAGDDSPFSADLRDGVAKGAKIYFLDCGGSDPNAIITSGDLNDYFGPAYAGNVGGAARVSSSSWGSDTGGQYTTTSMTADQFARSHPDFTISFSNGNAGTAGSVGSPASAKNILSSGGTQNGASAINIYSGTSRGPTLDNRRKPTVCSPAQNVQSAFNSSDIAYATLTGTSMSSPNLAGSATLMRQYCTDGFYPTGAAVPANGFTPSAALVRAALINSAVDDFASFTIPDNNIGWGRILLDNVMFFTGDTRRTVLLDEPDGVATGEVREYEIFVSDTSQPLEITLVWTDLASTPAAAINLVNDLDLVVNDGTDTYLGNVWSAGQSTTGGVADSRNVEENFARTVPVAGTYTIQVEGANVPFGPQAYAIVVSGGIGGSAGVVTLDAASYAPSASLGIRVEDTNAGASVTVAVQSTTESTPENVVIPGSNGVYEGTFPLTLAAPFGGSGSLSVSNGDQITVSYNDASPAHTSQATASVNTVTPVITSVAADPADITAVVTWSTNVTADSRIEYGTTPALGSSTTVDPALVTAHSHSIAGLLPETTYYFDVISSDHSGNEVRDSLGGTHYRFTTGKRADVLIVLADNTIDDAAKYAPALTATGWTFNTWGKAQADNPILGNSSTGLRSYKAVWWQVGWEQYPPFESIQRDTVQALHDGGARIAFVSHDVAWAFSVTNSGFWSAIKQAWFNNNMHATYQQDPATFSLVQGIAADPISGAYTGGVSYTPFRSGAAGDEINSIAGTGTVSYVWRDNDPAGADDISVRWANNVNNGTNGVGVWGGTPTRVVSMFWEWTRLNAASATDATRNDILDKTIQWLIGGDHPDVTVTSPNGGEVFVTSPVSIAWTASTDVANGRNLGSTRIDYSTDGGQSWTLITNAPGSSPYSWNVSGIPSTVLARVRVSVTDTGTPSLSGSDKSNANFRLNLPGNENQGPIVVAGSPNVNPNPIVKPNAATLTATVTDQFTGGSNVTQAEWSAGGAPAPAGTGTAMTGAFGAVQVAVSANLPTNSLPDGATNLWIRARDAAGNWGEAQQFPVQVNGGAVDVVTNDTPLSFAVNQNTPNPFASATSIRFAIPEAKPVTLKIFNVEGRLVRDLVDRTMPAGRHEVTWDGRDATGSRVTSGVYFYRFAAGTFTAEKKMVVLQ